MRPRVGREVAAASPRRGGVLVYAILAVLAVGAVTASFLATTSAFTRRGLQSVDQKQAFYLAEAGLGEAYSGMLIGKSGNVGSRAAPAVLGEGLFWVEVTDLGDDLVELRSTGMCGGGSASLAIVVLRHAPTIGSLGVFSSADLEVPPGALIDAYDSSLGNYESQRGGNGQGNGQGQGNGGGNGVGSERKRSDARVGSNGSITVHGPEDDPARIHGNVVPGPDGELITAGDPEITGTTQPGWSEIDLPDVECPKASEEPGIVHTADLPPLMIRTGDFGYEFLQVESGAELILQGPCTIVLDRLRIRPGGSLTFDTTQGEIELFVKEPLAFEPGSTVATSDEDPSLVTINVLDDGKDGASLLQSDASFYGVVYSKKGLLDVGPGFELFGSLVADRLRLQPSAKLHFDAFLNLVSKEMVTPSFDSWRLVGFQDPIPGRIGNDPFRKLGVDRSSLNPPDKAHEDQFLEIEYYDLGGALQTYAGMESGFDWSAVQSVVGGWRDGRYAAITGSSGTVLVK